MYDKPKYAIYTLLLQFWLSSLCFQAILAKSLIKLLKGPLMPVLEHEHHLRVPVRPSFHLFQIHHPIHISIVLHSNMALCGYDGEKEGMVFILLNPIFYLKWEFVTNLATKHKIN